ncbi:MAG: hypothetical protein ABSF23_17385 [Terracidiphilus sp.]|jgi:hypothetical protein
MNRIAKARSDRTNIKHLRDYVKAAAPEPEVLRIIGEESVRNGTNRFSMREIDRIIRSVRAEKRRRSKAV